MAGRSQRHLLEIRGEDSAGNKATPKTSGTGGTGGTGGTTRKRSTKK